MSQINSVGSRREPAILPASLSATTQQSARALYGRCLARTWCNMSTHSIRRASSEPRHDHAPDTDDVWAWIVIGLFAGAVTLAVWVPLIASLRLS